MSWTTLPATLVVVCSVSVVTVCPRLSPAESGVRDGGPVGLQDTHTHTHTHIARSVKPEMAGQSRVQPAPAGLREVRGQICMYCCSAVCVFRLGVTAATLSTDPLPRLRAATSALDAILCMYLLNARH
ncbi:hypothetical protein BT67DRAFT_15168 [Trichocladium antarcticum]|uniref:Secreted protein n=1 Tax=Trichocladium antarcticum TaxID=1450529 RepID=A0AAN6UVH6_9PEZI|nr:hypothetical protein BT67DRAFT_15168 [Trichocladium antarcticum]